MNEADTCRRYIVPLLQAAGWDNDPHSIAEQRMFTDGRIVAHGNSARRRRGKRADYILRYTRDFPLAVVEAKALYRTAAEGLGQAKEYAQILGLKFAYSSNGAATIEFDFTTGLEQEVTTFATPAQLWTRLRAAEGLTDDTAALRLLTPSNISAGKEPRYYQLIAINRVVQAILRGDRRVLITMATGTGKTLVAFQICWKLWSAKWNARNDPARRPRILYLADRNFLVDDPKDKIFSPFGDARWKIEGGEITFGREMYFATYQSLGVTLSGSTADFGGSPSPPQEERAGERRQSQITDHRSPITDHPFSATGPTPSLHPSITPPPFRYKEFPPDFFDLVIVDECHRGSAKEGSNWREILEYFQPACQLGMTATPLRDDNRDTYLYFGNPVYTYSLKQGIEDGFLAPYRVHRIVTQWDAAGWRPSQGDLDRFGRAIPDDEYQTADFERLVALRARTQAIARHLTDFLKKTDRFAKTIVFCVDQEHASEMRTALNNLNADLVGLGAPASPPASSGGVSLPGVLSRSDAPHAPTLPRSDAPPLHGPYPNYVERVTADEGDIGRGHMQRFQDVETRTPVILTTSQLLTTGLDAPTCRNVVLVRLVNSMVEFKQIIGRGTRVREDYGKLWFNILDYTGTATRNFADPGFDGDPAFATQEEIDEYGRTTEVEVVTPEEPESEPPADSRLADSYPLPSDGRGAGGEGPRKFYYDGGQVEIAAEMVHELDPVGRQLRVIKLTDYTAEKVRTLCSNPDDLRARWADSDQRAEIIRQLTERGIDFQTVAAQTAKPDADPLDLLCHLAFNAPLLTRRQRADRVRQHETAFFNFFAPEAREILDELLEKYAADGEVQFTLPDVLKVPPISRHGTVGEIAGAFGGLDRLRTAVNQLQTLLYAT